MKSLRLLTVILGSMFVLLGTKPLGFDYGVGDAVSDFKLKNVDGKSVALSDYEKHKGVILIFDCNTCPYSKAYNDRIIALHNAYSPKGFPVVTINSNVGPGDGFQDMVARAKSKSYQFPYLLDETQRVARSFGATNTPHVFILRRDEKGFVVAYIGAIDNNPRNASQASRKYVEEAVNALLQGQPVPTEKTKAVGCGIKWDENSQN